MSDTTQLPPLPGPDSKTPEATTPPKTPLSGQPAEPATTGDATMTPHDATSSEGDEAAPAEPPAPATFAELGVPAHLLRAIEKLGWTRPTEVQARAFTPGVEGKDLMVQSRTGSGKTGAFCLPWIASRFEPGDAKDTGVQLLVLLPTRELARQVCDQLVSLCDESEISVLPVYGGTAMNPQLDALARGVHAVVGTPGRILDHIRRRSLVLDKVRTVVLDECDEMLSMGFLEDIRSILERCPRERQTCLFSATVPPDISRIARRSMRDPIRLELSTDGISAAEIQHVYYSTSGSTIKTRALQDVIMVEDPSSAIVFCNTREETRIVANVLRKDGYTAEALSSDLTQAAREHVMKLMRERKLRFLVATDVAARGIDISHVSHVINYSFPENAESYVHRTGRTGRAGRKGKAVSIVSAQEIGSFYMLTKQYADITFEEQQLPDGDELSARRRQTKIDGITHRFSELVSADWTVLARDLMGDPRGEQVMALLLSDALSKSPSRDTQEAATDDQIAAREETQARRARRDGGSGRGRVRRRDRDAGEGERARAERPRRPTRDDEDGVTHSVTVEDEQPRQRADTTDGAAQEEDRPGRRRRRRRRGPSRGADEQATDADGPDAEATAIADAETESASEAAADDAPGTDATFDGETTSSDQPTIAAGEDGDATADPEAAEEGAPTKRRRRRRRRRGGARQAADEGVAAADSGAQAEDASETDAAASESADAERADGDTATSGEPKTKKRRRRRRRRGAKGDEENAAGAASAPTVVDGGQAPAERLAQGEIVIDIEDEELEVVREHFGDVDELGELTLRGMRRAVIDNLREEAVIEDLSEEDEEEETDETDEADEADAGASTEETPAAEDAATAAPATTGSDETSAPASTSETSAKDATPEASAIPDAATATSAGSADADPTAASEDAAAATDKPAAPAKKKRRRRRKKKAPFVPPELTAPPHKDFWEVWSGKFSSQDFDDEKYPLPEIPEPAPAVKSPRPSFERAPAEDDGDFVRVALSLGRKQGFKSAGIRGFLAEHADLKGRSVRDLTVRTNTSYFRIAEARVDDTIAAIAKTKVEEQAVELRRTSEASAPQLRAEVPDGLEEDVVADLQGAPTEDAPSSEEVADPPPQKSSDGSAETEVTGASEDATAGETEPEESSSKSTESPAIPEELETGEAPSQTTVDASDASGDDT